jgi:fimbrial chaperone protein
MKCLRLLAGLAAAFAAGGACAQLLINPVVVELAPKQRIASLTLSLAATAPRAVVFQAAVMRWTQDERGESRHEADPDVVVVPPVVELRPGQSQLVRVGLRGARRGSGEQAWRLVFEELPTAAATPAGAVSFRMRYDLPLMLAHAEPVREELAWERCDAGGQQLCVRAANTGNRRVTVRELTLAGGQWNVSLDEPVTLLAGSRREWRVARPERSTGELRTVIARTNRQEPIVAQLP